ncbi:histidine phosphatase family protein [Amycolatopsis suaedae]|uniref:Histidine phosphatase family protein n=1 Tax=Amycolatopsis suaedae TaxID=2510978 RepID=A0A4Q7J018_9PSEU|nr:histidine phosphatase family protein [Amycolatopsis suaedae]RZQ59703.1 histidine phosphatase family protein [Amycolatopsis suaedae]
MGAIYLVRHGQASFGAADYDKLSARGAEQAAVAGAELTRRGLPLTAARCGTLARQRDTATQALGEAEVITDPRWNEYDHVDIARHHGGGVAQDSADPRAFQHMLDAALGEWVRAGEDSPCAETWPAFLARVRGALDDLVAALGRGEHGVAFTSGGVISTLCGSLLGSAETGLLTLNRVTVNAGISKLVSGRSGLSLLSFNEHAHLDGTELLTYR